ncbi:MAG: hypothetical protein L3K19_00535 [Thermoplasmata archaeon]|nr:hypothetical protein [Thermoplasmata archaeon]
MPGAPNRPPEVDAAPAPAPPKDDPGRAVLRRLAPARVALQLDLWKKNLSPDLTGPFLRAETKYSEGDYPNAITALDQLSVRFAEPRWPTMPSPFRELRVAIPAPMPPSWNPDNALAPPDREAKQLRHFAELQLALARATLDWARTHSVALDDLQGDVDAAASAFVAEGPGPSFWTPIDRLWTAVHERVPGPTVPATARPAAAPAQAEAGADPA